MSNKKTRVKKSVVTAEQKNNKKKLLKLICIIVAALLVLLAVIYAVMSFVNKKVVEEESFIEQIPEVYETFTPFPIEWDVDLSKDADYLSFNPVIMFGEGEEGSLYSLEDFYANKDAGQKFFEEYFRILKEGDYEKYPGLFTEKYKETDPAIRFEKNVDREFPPQRVYDIVVRRLFSAPGTSDGKDCVRSIYRVDYKINKNSNLFRSDIGRRDDRDVSRPLYFELVTFDEGTDKEKTYIHNMYTESSAEAFAKKNSATED